MAECRKKVCFAASSGGHLEQLSMLRPLMERYDSFVVTEEMPYDTAVSGQRMYYLRQVNRREAAFLLRLLQNAWRSLGILRREKPDVVVTTGVLAVIPLCLLTKLRGGKLIYIESFAVTEHPTLTGRLLYRFADRFYVQWEGLLTHYPKARYLGGIY